MTYSWESGLGVDLKGQVVSGRGLAAAELLILREQVQTIVQEPLCPGSLNIRLMRQALYLQTFRHYGIKPGPLDLPAFVRTGLHLRTLKKLAGIYLRKA